MSTYTQHEFIPLSVLQSLPRAIPKCGLNRVAHGTRYCESAYCDRCAALRLADGVHEHVGVTFPPKSVREVNEEFERMVP